MTFINKDLTFISEENQPEFNGIISDMVQFNTSNFGYRLHRPA